MYGATVKSHTFMDRTANHSTKGSRRGFVDVETGVCPSSVQTLAQQRDNLKRKHAAMSAQRVAIKNTRDGSKEEWQRIGRDMQELQNTIAALNKVIPKRALTSFQDAFVECAKTMIPTSDFERIAEAARRRLTEQAP